MNYTEIQTYLNNHLWQKSTYGLENIKHLAKQLNNPQDKLNIIHIAGTNGKGSTVAYLSSILLAANFSVATYTSPEVNSYLDRFMIDGMPCSKNLFELSMQQVIAACQEIVKLGHAHPSLFEMEVACAWLLATEKQPHFFIMETGMGGRQDATNLVANPIICIITTISLDHMDFLGNHVLEIAKEKAGIIKKYKPIITWPHEKEVTSVLNDCATKLKAPFKEISMQDLVFGSISNNMQSFYYKNSFYQTSLLGDHQVINAAGSIEAIFELRKQGYIVNDESIMIGLKKVSWPGRIEKLSEKPLIFLDGAHNTESMIALFSTLNKQYDTKLIQVVMHVFEDKDYRSMLSVMQNKISSIVCTSLGTTRSLEAQTLSLVAKNILPSINNICFNHFEEGLDHALNQANDFDITIVLGSLSHLQTARKMIHKKLGDYYDKLSKS